MKKLILYLLLATFSNVIFASFPISKEDFVTHDLKIISQKEKNNNSSTIFSILSILSAFLALIFYNPYNPLFWIFSLLSILFGVFGLKGKFKILARIGILVSTIELLLMALIYFFIVVLGSGRKL